MVASSELTRFENEVTPLGGVRCPPNGYVRSVTPSLVKLAIVFLLTVLPLLTVFFMVLQVLSGAPRPVGVKPRRVAARKPRPAIRGDFATATVANQPRMSWMDRWSSLTCDGGGS